VENKTNLKSLTVMNTAFCLRQEAIGSIQYNNCTWKEVLSCVKSAVVAFHISVRH